MEAFWCYRIWDV